MFEPGGGGKALVAIGAGLGEQAAMDVGQATFALSRGLGWQSDQGGDRGEGFGHSHVLRVVAGRLNRRSRRYGRGYSF